MAPTFITQPDVERREAGAVEVLFDDAHLPRAFYAVAEASANTVLIHAADGQLVASAIDPANVLASQGAVAARFDKSFRTSMGVNEFTTFIAEFEGSERAYFDFDDATVKFSHDASPVVDLDAEPYYSHWPVVKAKKRDGVGYTTVETTGAALASGLTGAAIQRLYDSGSVELRTRNHLLVAEPVDQEGSEEYLVCEAGEAEVRSQFHDDYLREVAGSLAPAGYTVHLGNDAPLLLENDWTKIALANRIGIREGDA